MRLLLFSDLHCSTDAAVNIVHQSSEVDVVVGAGDFATVRRGIDVTIEILKSVTCPTVVIPGNSETVNELKMACRDWPAARVLHGTETEIDGIRFFGLGGAVPVTPFGSWSYDFTEEEAEALLSECPSHAVLVSHSPPKGIVDVSSSGRNLGSEAVRQFIDRKEPRLVVCGHIHDSAGQSRRIGQTNIINAGPRGTIWTLDA